MRSEEEKKQNLVEQAGSARLLLANQDIIFPMLKSKEEQAIIDMIHEFKTKGIVSLSHVATIASLRDMHQDLSGQVRRGERAMAELHKE